MLQTLGRRPSVTVYKKFYKFVELSVPCISNQPTNYNLLAKQATMTHSDWYNASATVKSPNLGKRISRISVKPAPFITPFV